MLLITCGDIAAGRLAEAGLTDRPVLVWADLLHEGPVPAGLGPAELRAVRARYAADAGWAPFDAVLARYEARDRVVAGLGLDDEVVCCFDDNLVNQLQLLQLLDALAGAGPGRGPGRITLAAVPDLGPTGPDELRAAVTARRTAGPELLTLAREAWAAFRSPDPTGIQGFPSGRAASGGLPALGPALARFLAQYPGARDGLSLTQRRALEAAAGGPAGFAGLFEAVAAREARRFLGDTLFRAELDDLAWARVPLLTGPPPRVPGPLPRVPGAPPREASRDPGPPPGPLGPGLPAGPEDRWRLTGAGADVLAGRADHVALNGIDRWLGGVHLRGAPVAWRWDGSALQAG